VFGLDRLRFWDSREDYHGQYHIRIRVLRDQYIIMVSIDLGFYYRNYKLDKQAEEAAKGLTAG
jgi:hypothetical protein